jgi:hypothetical protein
MTTSRQLTMRSAGTVVRGAPIAPRRDQCAALTAETTNPVEGAPVRLAS